MTEYSEADAQRVADRGRDALLERLRPAFHETARQHADILQLDDAQIEEMIQRAAERADGLQWRRALASVATEELGMSLGEALSSPVVARAQELAGAPSYEEALAALGLEPVSPSASENGDRESADARPPEPGEEPLAEAPAPDEPASGSEPEPVAGTELPASEESEEMGEAGGGATMEPVGDEPDEEAVQARPGDPGTLQLTATHLGGIATLEAGEQDLDLRLGGHGLDIARKPGRVLGRLRWREIRTLEVQSPRGLRRRRRGERAQLVIRTAHGDASFEVPGISEEELEASLAPLRERYGGES